MLLQMLEPFCSSDESSRELEVTNPEVARLLLEEKTLRVLSPFVGRERTVSSAAEELGIALNTLLYQIRRLSKAGLLIRTRLEKRAGKDIAHYRAVTERFLIPYGLTPTTDPEALLALEHAVWEGRLVRGLVRAGLDAFDSRGRPTFGLRVVLEGGRLVHKNVAGPDADYDLLAPTAPAIVDYWLGDTELTFAEAKALQREMCELVERYRGRRGGGRYLLRLALAPLEES